MRTNELLGLVLCLGFACGCGDSGDDSKAGSGGTSSGGSSSGGTGGTASGGSAGATGGASGSGTGGSGNSGGSLPGFPDDSNTGIPEGACPNGLVPATQAEIRPANGSTIECVLFDEGLPYIDQETTNITYKHCRFQTTDGDNFVNLQGGPVTFEECEFDGSSGTWIRASYDANDLTVRHCDFKGMANAVEFGTSNVLIEENYVHDFGNVSQDQHADGFQTEGANGFQILHNTILMNDVWGATSALLVSGDSASAKDNLVAGAGYTVHVAGDMEVTGNRFSTMFFETCGVYGPVYPEPLAATGVWSDNQWLDGPNAGQTIDAPSN